MIRKTYSVIWVEHFGKYYLPVVYNQIFRRHIDVILAHELNGYNIEPIKNGYEYLTWLIINRDFCPVHNTTDKLLKHITALEHIIP